MQGAQVKLLFASDARSNDGAQLLGGPVRQPRVLVRADAEQHHHQDGQHPLPHRQRLLPRLQVDGFLDSLLLLFRSMYRNVVSTMKEAQDITTHLRPLASHFEVDGILEEKLYLCVIFKWNRYLSLSPDGVENICVLRRWRRLIGLK